MRRGATGRRNRFVDRDIELDQLRDCYESDAAELIVLYDRRRLGKSELVRQSIAGRDDAMYYQAVESTARNQLDQFGVDVDEQSRDTRLNQPEASEFGIDDRPLESSSGDTEDQVPLVMTIDEQQNTLDGTGPTSRFETAPSE